MQIVTESSSHAKLEATRFNRQSSRQPCIWILIADILPIFCGAQLSLNPQMWQTVIKKITLWPKIMSLWIDMTKEKEKHFVVARVQPLCMTETGKGAERERERKKGGLSSITPLRHLNRKLSVSSVKCSDKLYVEIRSHDLTSHFWVLPYNGPFVCFTCTWRMRIELELGSLKAGGLFFERWKAAKKRYRVHDDFITCDSANKSLSHDEGSLMVSLLWIFMSV